MAQRDWSDALRAISGLTRAQMPELVEGSAVSATLRADLASEWGLAATVRLAGGGGDNAASAVGVGAVNAGGNASTTVVLGAADGPALATVIV